MSDTGDTQAEAELFQRAEESKREMMDAMNTMMSSSTNMMQAFIDMRMSYLKLMRKFAEDPATPFGIMAKNMADIQKAMDEAKTDKDG